MAEKENLKYFSQEFIDEMKQRLEEMKKDIEGRLGAIAEKNPHNPDDYQTKYVDYGDEEEDNVDEIEDYTVNKSTEVLLEKELRDVKAALGRIEEGTYGICKYTKEPISEERLRARPTSSAKAEVKKSLQGDQG